jgi:hypothetical protein
MRAYLPVEVHVLRVLGGRHEPMTVLELSVAGPFDPPAVALAINGLLETGLVRGHGNKFTLTTFGRMEYAATARAIRHLRFAV